MLTDVVLNALVGAGCDDATFSTTSDLTFVACSREAPTLIEAVVSAIGAVESVALEVLRVDPDELVWGVGDRQPYRTQTPVHRPSW